MWPKRIPRGQGQATLYPQMDSNAQAQNDNNDNSRTLKLDGSAIAPRHATRHHECICAECQDASWKRMEDELYEAVYKPLTREEFKRQLDYEYKIILHRNKRFGTPLTEDEWDDHLALKQKRMDYIDEQLHARKKGLNKTHVNHELGPREFTLTYSPSWFDDEEARLKMQVAIERLQRYYQKEIVEFHARGEVGKNGQSHVHCYYELKGGVKITDKNFKRAYPHWNPSKKTGKKGFEGGHHETVKVTADFKGYIEEDDAFNWLKVSINNNQNANEKDLSQEAHQSSQAWVPTYHP